GDPSIYSTCWYVLRRVQARGYTTALVPGVPSFCAAAAALGRALCEDDESLHILPASHGGLEEALDLPGSRVLMKAGRSIGAVRDALAARGELAQAALVERCGMAGERIVTDLATLDDSTGYFATILVKEDRT
ncbi:MAG: precorrin-2 C(20)-methyltransferase, partial [Eubacteriales bacterium]|nr:precorrin-2 C(20)-methyltransferase [Eubacteriales bacterium]